MMSREVTVRPLHLTPIGMEKVPTPADKIFKICQRQSSNNPMYSVTLEKVVN